MGNKEELKADDFDAIDCLIKSFEKKVQTEVYRITGLPMQKSCVRIKQSQPSDTQVSNDKSFEPNVDFTDVRLLRLGRVNFQHKKTLKFFFYIVLNYSYF